MEMPQDEADHLLIPLRDRLLPLYEKGELKKTEPDFWAARAFLTFSPEGHADRGIFSVYFFNLVSMEPGQALFQDAGIPHAYLEGQNVEIMANSDNVLRGGLTTKHIAVDELLKHVLCIPVQPAVQSPSLDSEYWFTTKVDDFRLGQIKLNRGEQLTLTSVEPSLLLCLDGEVELVSNERSLILKPGQPSAFWQKGSTLQLKALTDCRIFRANTGFHTR
jgi:mannose-6-phosphate isomerase